eukprot:TRINITY_DN21040_c0_g1_i1.p1 TRINITY_DN21040_c0_g1~~TRINITY_DN21040_c0_g1_i1.p1  ORF type:complete len:804 (+),score=143.30 TRINITY_DN21040_c0_g1_i1:77-2488(+)
MNELVMWMGDRKSKRATVSSSYGGPSREERARKTEMWKNMLNGTQPAPTSAPTSPPRVRKVKFASNQKSVACQVEVRKVRRDPKDTKGQAYWCCRCQGLLRGGERQALAHWVSKCMKGLSKLHPPVVPDSGRFPSVQIVGNGRQCTIATQEKLPGVYESQQLVARPPTDNDSYKITSDEPDGEFVVNYFQREPSFADDDIDWSEDDDFTVHTVGNIHQPSSPKNDKIHYLHRSLEEADQQLDILTQHLTQSFSIDPNNSLEVTGSRTEKLLQLDRLIKSITVSLSLQRIGKGYLARRSLLQQQLDDEPTSPLGVDDATATELLSIIQLNIESASIKAIQRCGKGYLSRIKINSLPKKEHPTTTSTLSEIQKFLLETRIPAIQNVGRGYLCRRHLLDKSSSDMSSSALDEDAILRLRLLQRVGRAFVSRSRLVEKPNRNPIRIIQAVGQGYLVRLRCSTLYKNIPKLTDTFLSPLTCASPLSCSGVQDFLLSTRVPSLQRIGRGYLERLRLSSGRSATGAAPPVGKKQKVVKRGNILLKKKLLLQKSSKTLQRIGRGYCDRQFLQTALSHVGDHDDDSAIATLQRLGRGMIARLQVSDYRFPTPACIPIDASPPSLDECMNEHPAADCASPSATPLEQADCESESHVTDCSSGSHTNNTHHSEAADHHEVSSQSNQQEDPADDDPNNTLSQFGTCVESAEQSDAQFQLPFDNEVGDDLNATSPQLPTDDDFGTCRESTPKGGIQSLTPIATMCLLYLQRVGRGGLRRSAIQSSSTTLPSIVTEKQQPSSALSGFIPSWVRHITG